jgi:hypothetical protein
MSGQQLIGRLVISKTEPSRPDHMHPVGTGPHHVTITLDGDTALIDLGGDQVDGALTLRNAARQEAIRLRANGGHIDVIGDILVGSAGSNGNLRLRDTAGREVIHLQADGCNLFVGSKDANGNLRLRDTAGREVIHLQADGCNLFVGNKDANGNLRLRDASGRETIHLQADGGNILVNGDIHLRNADCAEDFEVLDATIDAGMVMIVESEYSLRPCQTEYDRRVAGVISGGGGYKPAIVLDKQVVGPNRMPLALMGKVFCKVDAQCDSIVTGDLLTTSSTPGHAMKAVDSVRAFGAVIGKALRPLESGKGLIPILVALQ